MNKMYFRGAHAALIVYDITKRESFERAKYWIEQVLQIEEGQKLNRLESEVGQNPEIKIFLVGSKCDMAEKQEVALSDVDKFVKSQSNGNGIDLSGD